jgi:chromate reductase
MTQALDIIALVGSLRRDSYTRRLVQAIASLALPGLQIEIADLAALPMYNQDDEADPSVAVRRFRERILRSDGVLFATPEYNRSIPAVLKNAIDIGSRPYGQSVWAGKAAAVISNSPGALGAFGANHALRQSLVFLDMPTLQQPEAYVGHVDRLFDAEGQLADPAGRQFLQGFARAFEAWVRRLNVSLSS